MSQEERVPLVLGYHAVSARWPHALAIEVATLERQVSSLLRRGYRPVGAGGVAAGSGKLLHVTFDDAFRSLAVALPVLERLGVPVTVFACSAFADSGRALDLPELAADAARYPAELATLDWDALRSLVERGVEVGSHTVSHPHLPRLTEADAADELQQSKERIEAELGRPCRFLAYPFGESSEGVRAAARAAGFEAAFGMPGREDGADPFNLPRVGIWRKDGPLRTRLKTTTAARRGIGAALTRARGHAT